VRAAGSQGVQNGAISCRRVVLSSPAHAGHLGENVIAAWLDLEVASGNDAILSHSRSARPQLMDSSCRHDFRDVGYSVMPRHDNTFGGGATTTPTTIDEWLTIQRDGRSTPASSR